MHGRMPLADWPTLRPSARFAKSPTVESPQRSRTVGFARWLFNVVCVGCVLAFCASRVNAAPGDTQLISPGDTPTLSADGRYVAFRWDGNPDPQGYFTNWNIYLRDRLADTTARISDDASDWEPHDEVYWGNNAALSEDGRYVAFMSQTFDAAYVPHFQVLLHDHRTGTTRTIASFVGPGPNENFDPTSGQVAISTDGRFVVFDTSRDNLVSNDTNDALDVFVYDRTTGSLERVSVASGGQPGNGPSHLASITPNGRYVAFWSSATNLVPGDTNGVPDVFVRDRQNGVTHRVSVNSDGAQAVGPGSTYGLTPPAMSRGARFVAFMSDSDNLAPGDANGTFDVFVRDRVAGTTERIDSGPGGVGFCGRGYCNVSLSAADGRFVAFVTRSALVRGDNNDSYDVYVHDRWTDKVEIASVRNNGLQLPDGVQPSLSADGSFVALHGFGPESFANERIYVHELGGTGIWSYRVVGGGDFGTQTVGTTSTSRYFSVRNTGSVDLTIERIELRGTNSASFSVLSRCGATLAVGARCNVQVSFAPQTAGTKAAKLAVVFALREGSGVMTKELRGTAVN